MIHVTDPSQLPELIDALHDRHIDLDRHELSEETSTLSFPRVERKRRVTVESAGSQRVEGVLEFRQVERYSIEDKAGIGLSPVNTLRFDEADKRISLIGAVPFEVTIWVRRLDIRLTP